MSKSLGNFITINELLETEKFGDRKWPGEVLRLAMLMTHYREPIDFTMRRLEEALALWTRWGRVLAEPCQLVPTAPAEFLLELADDLNTPALFRRLGDYYSAANRGGLSGHETNEEIENRRQRGAAALAGALEVLGVAVGSAMSERMDSVTREMIGERLAAFAAKDFKRADEIRAALLAEGIQLMDSKNESGERVTKWEIKR